MGVSVSREPRQPPTRRASGVGIPVRKGGEDVKSREVDTLRIGPLHGWATGGLSWGDLPTEAMDCWHRTIMTSGDDDYDNPYADLCYRSLGLVEFAPDPDNPARPYVSVRIATVTG